MANINIKINLIIAFLVSHSFKNLNAWEILTNMNITIATIKNPIHICTKSACQHNNHRKKNATQTSAITLITQAGNNSSKSTQNNFNGFFIINVNF